MLVKLYNEFIVFFVTVIQINIDGNTAINIKSYDNWIRVLESNLPIVWIYNGDVG